MKQFKMHCQYPLRHSNNDGVYMPADVGGGGGEWIWILKPQPVLEKINSII